MWAVRNRTIALVVCVLVATAGCSRAEPTTPAATLGAAPSPTEVALTEAPTPTEPSDPYAIPSDPKDIDKAYVEKVVLALDRGVVEATRAFVRDRAITPAVKSAMAATHKPTSQRGYFRAFRAAASEGGRLPFRTNPRLVDIKSVDEIISATKSCLFVALTQDSSGLVREPIEPFQVYYHLVAQQDRRTSKANPTPWMVAADSEPPRGGKEFKDPCAN